MPHLRKTQSYFSDRGEVWALVTHRPEIGRENEVSILAGYTYKISTIAEVTIATQTAKLFTRGNTAWATDRKTDDALVDSMIKGATMVVTGTSNQGVQTVDTYSLSGFAKAYQAIGKACLTH